MLLVPMAARMKRCITQQSSLVAREEASPAIASGPSCSRIAERREVISSNASSHVASRAGPPRSSRMSGAVSRSREREKRWAKRPLRQVWPLFAGPSAAGEIDTTVPSIAWVSRRQPTPQYPQVVVVSRVKRGVILWPPGRLRSAKAR
jgi:hypothetical protein